jgi:Transcriptional activator of glycolytic enzymes
MQEDPAHVVIRGVVPIVADAISAVNNRLSVGQDRLLRATLTTPTVTADLVRRALQEQTAEQTAVLSASVSQRPRVLVVVPPEDVKDGILEADGLQRALVPVTATATATAAAAAVSNTVVPAAAVAALPTTLDAGGGGDETRPAACPESCPVEPLRESVASMETLRESVASMETLLREWFEGLGGSPSVRELEERFEGRWRYTSALRQRFYVRRKLVRWVETRAAAAEVSAAVVAAAMDRLGQSPDRFYRELGKGRDPLANVALK